MQKNREKIQRFGVSMPIGLIEKFDKFISHRGYRNRSEAIRDLVRQNLVVDKEWGNPNENVVGVFIIVYSSKIRELSSKLTQSQHHHYEEIISSLHIHMDKDNCLEVIIIKGKAKNVKHISEEISATKGVKYAYLAPATTGEKII